MTDIKAFAKAVAPRKTVIFALQKSIKHLSLLVAFRQTEFQIKPLLSAKTLAAILKDENLKTMWTHLYDLIAKLGTLFLSLFILTNIPFISDNSVLVPILAIIITVFAYIFYLRTLSSLLYCKFTLGMNINFKEAKELNPALSPNPFSLNGYTWLPLKEIKRLDNNDKYESALRLMHNWLINKTHK